MYGWSDDEINDLPIQTAEEYLMIGDTFRARECLENIQVASFGNPNVKKESRTQVHKAFYKRAFPASFDDKATMTTKDVFKKLGKMNG